MKKTILALATIWVFAACKRDSVNVMENAVVGDVLTSRVESVVLSESPLSKEDVDNTLKGILMREHDFHWEWTTPDVIWSAGHYGDQSMAIGYTINGLESIDEISHTIDLKSSKWKATHDAIIQLIKDTYFESTGKALDWNEVLVEDDEVLPIITINMVNREVIQALMNLENVRYIEPIDYILEVEEQRSSSGCDPSSYSVSGADYTWSTPNCMIPWNFNNMNIPNAWSQTQGQGITVGVIDAGISSSQSLLNGSFNNGDSNVGRSRTVGYTLGGTAYTSCSHGTSMSGLAVGPRNNTGATTGVAYKSNLFFVRACNDVVLDSGSERTAVKNALVGLGNTSDVKVISMSIGTPFGSSVLKDGVNYATNMGKLVFAAAGTSFSWTAWWGVIYPAAYSNCVAITGVNENSQTCDDCHDGGEVDFTVVMERNSNDSRNSLSLPQSGTWPTYIGGSSCATATAAGIGALVWSIDPTMTRAEVLNILTITSQYYPGQSSSRGYGNLNAGAAVAAAQNAM
ncbi:MAG: S8 family serine peptidase [Flavobacteriales bacterium]